MMGFLVVCVVALGLVVLLATLGRIMAEGM
jgi:hypothetical protein